MKFEKEVMQNLAMITQLGISMLAPIILCVLKILLIVFLRKLHQNF